ncbi:MAG TPA: ABC transporter permease [Balneolales bacterium]|nr:ABC transporter permease [Balneolales bacterium]
MLRNYIKIAIRNLRRNKLFSLINIIGLAIGTLCCLYILLYVNDQYSYDSQYKNASDIYRVNTILTVKGKKTKLSTASPPIAPAMKNDFPEIKQFTRVINTDLFGVKEHLIRYKNKKFYEKNVLYADSTFFDIFTYHFIFGQPADALLEPYSVVLFKPVAEKLFGDKNPVNKVIKINYATGKHAFKVTGVVDNSLGHSHIKASMFITMDSGGVGQYVLRNKSWGSGNFVSEYVKLKHNTDAAALAEKLPAFLHKYGAQQLKQKGWQKKLVLEPVTSIHTTTGYANEMGKPISSSFLYLLLLIAVLIEVIACINFMNLSTARASKRAKEVGVRKVIGADKMALVKQFLGESFLLTFIGVLIALPLLYIVLPYLNQITQVHIQLTFLKDYRVWLVLTSLIIITGFVAGSYPAFYLSAFKTVNVIKGNFTHHISTTGIRKALVVFQFVVSIVLIAGMLIIYHQLYFINHKNLGFDRHQRLIFHFYSRNSKKKMSAFATELRQLPDVKSVSSSSNYLSQFISYDHGVYLKDENNIDAIDTKIILSDRHFVKTNGIKMIGGRDFHQNDDGKVLINKKLMKQFGLTLLNAPGTKLYMLYQNNRKVHVEIVGVMNNFNFNSLHKAIKPFMLMYNTKSNYISYLTVAVNSKNYKSLLGKIKSIWHKDLPATPFTYAFLNKKVQKQYETEITLSNIINSFTLIAILISCLGLFGLVTFSAVQKRKEIGIRKVHGALISDIVTLLSKEFLKLVGIGFLIAIPIAWYAMHRWLQNFAYHIHIGIGVFLLAGILAMVIALATVSWQSVRAALLNPVESLRNE